MSYLDKDLLYRKYVIEGLTCEEISKEISTARTTVLKYLKVYGIPVRAVGTNQKRRRGIAYGQKNIKRTEVAHKKELEYIERMKKLRSDGYSYGKIAEIFNSMKVPTKSQKGKWHSKTIYQILNKS